MYNHDNEAALFHCNTHELSAVIKVMHFIFDNKYCGLLAQSKNCYATETSKHACDNRSTSVYSSLLGNARNNGFAVVSAATVAMQ
jgi:hypothetical protein